VRAVWNIDRGLKSCCFALCTDSFSTISLSLSPTTCRCPLSPPVELQLCAHFLRAREITSLSRCDRRIFADCSAELTWRHALFPVQRGDIERAQASTLIQHLSMQHVWNDSLPHGATEAEGAPLAQ
jgi:hypothetical protein